VTTCYYCGRPEGAPHLPECPKAPGHRFDWADADQASRPPETINEWAIWHAAHRGCAGYNGTAGTCVHVQETAKAIGGFVTAQAAPTPPGSLRPPTRDELAAFERSKVPVQKWDDFDRQREAAIRSYGVTKGEMRHPTKAPDHSDLNRIKESFAAIGGPTSLIPSDAEVSEIWHAAHFGHAGYDKAAETCGGFCDDDLRPAS
jgi:hypothetical protein